jgi:hypothetical protein
MMRFRPIDEELKNLHEPVAVTISEDDDTDVSLKREICSIVRST